MASYYAIAALRTNETGAPDQIMLYRFKNVRDRYLWAKLSDYRLPVTRDVARILFPKIREAARDSTCWGDMNVSLNDPSADVFDSRPKYAPCQYLLDSTTGGVAHESWEMIPDYVTDSETVKNKFRRELESAKWRSQFVK